MTGLTLALSILTAVIGTASAAGEEAPGARVPPSQIVLYDASPFFFARGGRGGFAAIEGRLSCACAQRFGSRAQFRALVRAAHARGLRVLLDMAANHLSDESPYYRDAQRRGRRSSYYDRFERDGSRRALHYFDWTHLENRMRPGRCANAIRTFWPRLRARLARIDPNIARIRRRVRLDLECRGRRFGLLALGYFGTKPQAVAAADKIPAPRPQLSWIGYLTRSSDQ